MDEGARCERCPLYGDCPEDSGHGLLCSGMIEYPVWIEENTVSVMVESEDDLPRALEEFTSRFYTEVMKKPGITIDPRALRRFKASQDKKAKLRQLCPFSFPTDGWAKLALEQVLMDTGGMQIRFLRNDRPWLEQPAIYTDVVDVVQRSRGIASRWLEDKKKTKEDTRKER